MKPAPLIVVFATAASLIFYSITMACGDTHETSRTCAQDTTAVSADWAGTVVQVALTDLNEAAGQSRVERTYTAVKTSVRAGMNLTKALYRAAAHRAVVIARTVYHTAAAMT